MVIRFNTGRAKFIQLDVFKLGPERSEGAEGSNMGKRKWEAKKPRVIVVYLILISVGGLVHTYILTFARLQFLNLPVAANNLLK
jgi:hypothetical protein